VRLEISPGLRLFVDTDGPALTPEGQPRPSLLLIHGGPGFDHSSFRPFFSRFADIAQVVYFDLRGHGRSDDCPPEQWTLDTFADDVVRLCAAMGITRPWVLGQSFGGFVAQRYLARHPGHAARVVLSSTSHHFGLARKVEAFRRLGGEASAQAAHAFWQDPGPATWAAYEQHCRGLYNTTPQPPSRTRFKPEILFTHTRGELRSMNLRPGLAAARCPVLVMAGEEDPVTPPQDAAEIVAALPPGLVRFERFPGVGHGPWRDDAAATERVLREFLSELRHTQRPPPHRELSP
jgi:pimeloyl-ACP methyl ester carboxylesterase